VHDDLLQLRLKLLDNGFEPIPVAGKDSLLKGWTTGPITEDRVTAETRNSCNTNTGFRTGRTVGVDNDLRDPLHAAAATEITEYILGPTPLIRFGSKGRCSFTGTRPQSASSSSRIAPGLGYLRFWARASNSSVSAATRPGWIIARKTTTPPASRGPISPR